MSTQTDFTTPEEIAHDYYVELAVDIRSAVIKNMNPSDVAEWLITEAETRGTLRAGTDWLVAISEELNQYIERFGLQHL